VRDSHISGLSYALMPKVEISRIHTTHEVSLLPLTKVTKCVSWALMPQKCIGGLGCAPDDGRAVAYSAPPEPLAGFERWERKNWGGKGLVKEGDKDDRKGEVGRKGNVGMIWGREDEKGGVAERAEERKSCGEREREGEPRYSSFANLRAP